MRIHHLDCGSLCPVARRLINGDGGLFERGRMVCHCLLIEGPDGLILVETGMGTGDVALGMPWLFEVLGRPQLSVERTAVGQVRALGFEPADVRHIVVTHLDLDHAGGLPDFPHATVHLHARELKAAQRPRGSERQRYLQRHFAHQPRWAPYAETSGDRWFGFEAVRALEGLPPEILLVPLPGHTRGHSGVAVQGPDGWLLHGGDAWFAQEDLRLPRRTPAGLKLFQWAAAQNNRVRRESLAALQRLAAEDSPVRLVCAHDPRDLPAA